MPARKKGEKLSFESFRVQPDDALGSAHELTLRFVEEAVKLGESEWYPPTIALKATEAGLVLLEASPAASRDHVLAFLAQAGHWDKQTEHLRSQANSGSDRVNVHLKPEGKEVLARRCHAVEGIRTLLRRRLPLESADLTALATWMLGIEPLIPLTAPVGQLVKSVEWYLERGEFTPQLHQVLRSLTEKLEAGVNPDARKVGLRLRTILQQSKPLKNHPPVPAAAGSAHAAVPAARPEVLTALKSWLGMLSDRSEVSSVETGPDRFPLREDSPLKEAHTLLTEILEERLAGPAYYDWHLKKFPSGRKVTELDGSSRTNLLLAAAERAIYSHLQKPGMDDMPAWSSSYALMDVFNELIGQEHSCDRRSLFDLLLFMTSVGFAPWLGDAVYISAWISQIEEEAAGTSLAPDERHILHRLRARLVRSAPLGNPTTNVSRLTQVLGDAAWFFLVPGEAWSDAVNDDLAMMQPKDRENWTRLLTHALTATSSRPSPKWLTSASAMLDRIGRKPFLHAVMRWLPAVGQGRSVRLLCNYFDDGLDPNGLIHDQNATTLRGLVWLSATIGGADVSRLLGQLAVSCYRKVPGVGPRAVKVGNAAVYAISQINGPAAVGQLAMLSVGVKFGTAQKEIEKALNTAAQRVGLPREDLEEMGVPTYGLTEIGLRREQLGDCTAELAVTPQSHVELRWFKADGKPVKSVPASVKKVCAEDLKELKTAVKDIERMLSAQRERLDQLFLQQKTWAYPVWRERYLDHPLVGTLARRLIWRVTHDGMTTAAASRDGRLVDVQDRPVAGLNDTATIALWHPIDNDPEQIRAWRDWLEHHEIRQPFKQAHREVYLLTDAERQTATYSNRYAAHILKQHQFNALCAARSWRNSLRLMVDQEFPPATRLLPQWGLRAEFWIEGVGEEYGTHTNETGTFYYVSTDQVRFYALDAPRTAAHACGGSYDTRQAGEPVPLEQIPPLVLSEILRDVDLFVGVASVGNDPAWQDGGPDGRYRDYWTGYSFGELSQTAQTRKQVLERLVPRLKIADRCSFDHKFLVVRGDLRTYKIHLGSGNILMEPNDQYLCVVARQGQKVSERVFLPFEGDQTLAIILSKAMLLAEDTRILDQTIISQIRGKP